MGWWATLWNWATQPTAYLGYVIGLFLSLGDSVWDGAFWAQSKRG